MIPRSLLFVPGDRPERFDKAGASGADLIILDLEDSVAAANRPVARRAVADYLARAARPARPLLFVRMNPLASADALDDLVAVMAARPDGVVLPKAEGAADVERLGHYLETLEVAHGARRGSTRVLPIATETPRALFALDDYRRVTGRLIGLTWGAEDLTASVGAAGNRRPDGQLTDLCRLARSLCLAGATSAELSPIETVFTAIKDLDGLRAYAEAGRREGYVGMMAIHPSQVSVINEVFTPTAAEIERARRIVDLFAANPTLGVIALDGAMIDQPHLKQARRILSQSGHGL